MIRPRISLVVGLALTLALIGCRPPEPAEVLIRGRITAMQTALNQGKARAFMAPIADDFSAATGNLDRRAAGLLLRREMLTHQRLRARLVDLDVTLQGEDRATASMHAILTGGSGLIPNTGGWYRVETGWRLDDGQWMLISARWETVAGKG